MSRAPRNVSYTMEFDSHVVDVLEVQDYVCDDRLMAVEWELARARSFDRYDLISTKNGIDYRALITEPFKQGAVVVVFSATDAEVLVHDIAKFDWDDDDDYDL